MKNIPYFLKPVSPLFVALLSAVKACPPCPMCMPKYAALLAFFGLEGEHYIRSLALLTILFMCISLVSMYINTKRKQSPWYPLVLACISCGMILSSKYCIPQSMMIWGTYLGISTLFISTFLHHQSCKKSCCKALTL